MLHRRVVAAHGVRAAGLEQLYVALMHQQSRPGAGIAERGYQGLSCTKERSPGRARQAEAMGAPRKLA